MSELAQLELYWKKQTLLKHRCQLELQQDQQEQSRITNQIQGKSRTLRFSCPN